MVAAGDFQDRRRAAYGECTVMTFTVDPYKGKTLVEMKQRCNELVSALLRWQTTAMILAKRHGTEGLPPAMAAAIARLLESDQDDGAG